MKWNYKTVLEDKDIYAVIEGERGIVIPEELRALVKEGNGATPEKYRFMLGTSEKVLGAILSFNREETDTDTVFTALEAIEDRKLMPFAIDAFGNYICLDLGKCEVVFWDHETGDTFSTEKDVKMFMESLY